MYLKNWDVDHLATSSTVLNFTLPGTIFTIVGSFGCDITNLALMTRPIFSPYLHLIHLLLYKTNQEGTVHLPTTKTGQDSFYLNQLVCIYIFRYCFYFTPCAVRRICSFLSFFLYNWCYYRTSCASHIRAGSGALVAERKNFKLLFGAGIILLLRFRIYIFSPMRMIHAILSRLDV